MKAKQANNFSELNARQSVWATTLTYRSHWKLDKDDRDESHELINFVVGKLVGMPSAVYKLQIQSQGN